MAGSRELNTWKEVANYLGKGIRTVQNWERKHGLPIKRLGAKGQITVTEEELDAWKEARLIGKQPDAPVETKPSTEMAAEGQPKRRWSIRRKPVLRSLMLVTAIALALGASLLRQRHAPQPDHFVIEERLLTVFDPQNENLWQYVFPKAITTSKVLNTDPQIIQKYKILDGKSNGGLGMVFAAWNQLYCFRNDGTVAWVYKPGRAVTARSGELIPGDYTIELVGALTKPRRDGGQILVGAHRGPTGLFVVELLTKDGKKVGEYFHFGWFYVMEAGTLADSGDEDIFLGGVDNVSGNAGDYGATLVVLDRDKVWGQAATLATDARALLDIPPAEEKALLVIKEFAPNHEPHMFCRGWRVIASPGMLDLFVSQGSGQPSAHFIFDNRLRLQSVVPDAYLLQILRPTVLKGATSGDWPELLKTALGDIRYIRNGL